MKKILEGLRVDVDEWRQVADALAARGQTDQNLAHLSNRCRDRAEIMTVHADNLERKLQ